MSLDPEVNVILDEVIPEMLEILEALCNYLGVQYDFEEGEIVEVEEEESGIFKYGVPTDPSITSSI